MQESALVLGMVLRRFELIDHQNYQLRLKTTLTIKPDGLTIKVRPRPGRSVSTTPVLIPASRPAGPYGVSSNGAGAPVGSAGDHSYHQVTAADRHNTPLLVLYGSK